MNFHITTEGKKPTTKIKNAEPEVTHAEDEDKRPPRPTLVDATKEAAQLLAKALGGDELHIEVSGHETTKGKGFKPGHLSVSVSRLNRGGG